MCWGGLEFKEKMLNGGRRNCTLCRETKLEHRLSGGGSQGRLGGDLAGGVRPLRPGDGRSHACLAPFSQPISPALPSPLSSFAVPARSLQQIIPPKLSSICSVAPLQALQCSLLACRLHPGREAAWCPVFTVGTQAERLLGALFLLWAALVAQLKCELITRIVMKSNLLWCFMVTSWR